MKFCKTCQCSKPLSEFHKARIAKGTRPSRGGQGVAASCKPCAAANRKPTIHEERAEKSIDAQNGVKLCSLCKIKKPKSEFHKRKASPDGLCYKCKDCSNAFCADWRTEHPDAHKYWYLTKKGDRAEYGLDYREKNKDRLAANYKRWEKANKHIRNALVAKRMAAKLKATPKWADLEAIKRIYAEAVRLTEETGIRHEVDHIYPLQGKTSCGLHCEANLQILTKVENIRKSNRMPEEYYESCRNNRADEGGSPGHP